MQRIQLALERLKAAVRKLSMADAVIVAAGIVLALLLRLSLRSFQSDDFIRVGNGWYQTIKDQGFLAFRNNFSDYNPPYLYCLYLVSVLLPGIANVSAVKIPSILADFLCAWFVYRTVRLRYPQGPVPLFAFLAILFAPTVVLNGALWGQADILFTTGLVACLYYLLKEKDWLACTWFGIAVTFKLQGAFLAPLLLLLCLKRKVAWKAVLLVPAVYLVSILPAWIAGRPLLDLLTIYPSQVGSYTTLTNNVPNLYNWFPGSLSAELYPAGLLFAAGICFVYLAVAYKSRIPLAGPVLVELALVSVLLVPYCLPRMHDRYFFPADVIAIIYAFFFPDYFLVALLTSLVSFFAYQPFLFHVDLLPMSLLALVLLGVIVVVVRRMMLSLFRPRERPGAERPGPA